MKTWTLRGATTSYVVGVAAHGAWAQLVAWGPHAVADGPSVVAPVGTEHFLPRADVEPLEYAVRGVRYAAPVDLVLSGPDGVDELRPVFVEAIVAGEDEAARSTMAGQSEELLDSELGAGGGAAGAGLELVFADPVRGVRLSLHYRVEGDAVERWVVVSNRGADVLTLHRHDSAGFTVPAGNIVKYLWGEWNSEFQQSSIALERGRFSVGSAQGITGHSYSPYLVVDGEVAYGVQLAWSGSWEMTAEADTTGTVRIQAGRVSSSQGLQLRPGETWTSPKAVGACSAEGTDGLARVFHEYELARSRRRTPKVLYNSWFATEFDIRADHQLELARRAAGIGVETFVVDDGWFTGRVDDAGGLGDWEVDPVKFPQGLDTFIADLKELGLDFGLWVEPESVNPRSRLAAEHPEWILRTPDREPVLIRNQLLLDLSRDDVTAFVWSTLDQLLSTHDISYLKWDANRPRLDSGDQRRDLDGRVVTNLYGILDRLRVEHPDVLVEGCAGGGARVDLGMAARVDTLWPSDNTAPLDRLRIQQGFRTGFAPHLMSSWVTDAEGTHDGRERSLDFRFHVAMSGVLGIGADLSRWTDEQLKTATRNIEQYKDIRDIVAEGKVYGLQGGVQYVGPQRSVVFLWETGDGNVRGTLPTRPLRVPLAGLDPAKNYRVGDETLPGSYLLQVGVLLDGTADSHCLVVEALD
ncbi:alpha-galactosidase [Kribbella albertanoniae]|uniref:alpha-galactosidase n=1 Tax=Kribbella albertanoniae TaxID=1266829 RepID=A0A4R4PGI5_9ACTN|nr:alpha-galactosidase [Kribbella albertanoniae]TDC21022.1 alpha-galactosidase [Kribbella albertanoniae]